MLTKFKIFEEIKRKVPRSFIVGKTFTPFDPIDHQKFGTKETELLEKDDFIVNGNIAVCKEENCIFEIEKSRPDEFTAIYELRIKDEEDKIIHSRKFRCDTMNRIKMLNNLLNLCAAYLDESKREKYKDIDPYGEEKWEDESR